MWILLALFVLSGSYILHSRHVAKSDVKAQFVVTSCVLIIFYVVCFISGLCTILNFLSRWIF